MARCKTCAPSGSRPWRAPPEPAGGAGTPLALPAPRPMSVSVVPGDPYSLGASWDRRRGGTNFALFTEHGTRVDLCLFDPKSGRETQRVTLPKRTEHVWHGFVKGVQPGQLYGYRVHGRYAPREGMRFNPTKLLIDPYARAI